MSEQNKKLEYVEEIFIHAYLSYRCRIEKDIAARELLKKHCADQGIKLICDEIGVQEGNNLIAFMDDLTAARCIFLFLSPAYFQSAYTLYELVSIHERADLDRRFIYPVRLIEDMSTYQWTAAKKYWQENEDVRNELARLLNHSDINAVWQRVNAAWNSIIFPYLNELHSSLEQGDNDCILHEMVSATRQAVNAVVEESKQELRDKVRTEITQILKSNSIPIDKLKRELHLDQTVAVEGVARRLVEENEVIQSIAIMTKVVQAQKERLLTSMPEQWNECFYDAQQLCGWLLINSVDSVWWFNQQLKMRRAFSKGISNTFSLTHAPYVEVIISRSLLQAARYKLDDEGWIQPASEHHDVTLLFDGNSDEAVDIGLLAPIYKDLIKPVRIPEKRDDLLKKIYTRVKSYRNVRDGKPIYYLVGRETLKMLESRDWFVDAQQELAGCLLFVCCDVNPKNYDQSPCKEDQASLLDQYALLLSMRK